MKRVTTRPRHQVLLTLNLTVLDCTIASFGLNHQASANEKQEVGLSRQYNAVLSIAAGSWEGPKNQSKVGWERLTSRSSLSCPHFNHHTMTPVWAVDCVPG